MKKSKILIFLLIFLLTGCFERNSMENIKIYTTSYPVEYVTTRLYGNHSTIKSIYPDGMKKGYIVSDKLLDDYSKGDLFIFNSLMEYYELNDEGKIVLGKNGLPNVASEKKYVSKMLDNNSKLKIIDVSLSISYEENINELWLDPINLLTIANNIKKGFHQYITSKYLLEEIDSNYQSLKDELLKLDADYREVADRSKYDTLLTSNNLLRYLSKYNINVVSFEDENNINQKDIKNIEELIQNGNIKYVYVFEEDNINGTLQNLIDTYGLQIIKLHNLNNLTDEERKNNEDYFTLMYSNLNKIKEELYK